MMNNWLVLAVIALGIVGAMVWFALRAPQRPAPTGPHAVGTRLLSVTDPERTGIFEDKPGVHRELAVRVWYPAAPGQEGKGLTTMDGRVGAAFAKLYGVPAFGGSEPASASLIDVQPLTDGAPFPVVVFSHGAFSELHQNFSTMQELASHGFVVVSVGHTYESVLTLFGDGRSVPIDTRLASAMKDLNKVPQDAARDFKHALEGLAGAKERTQWVKAAYALGEVYPRFFSKLKLSLRDLVDQRVMDLQLVLSSLERWTSEPGQPLFGLLDTDRVGLMGHSLGGYSMLRLALRHKVEAVVALDVPFFLFPDDEAPVLDAPVLSFYAERTEIPGGLRAQIAGANRFLASESAREEHLQLELRGATHMNFTDMNFLPRVTSWLGLIGKIDGAAASETVNQASLGFLSRHLQGKSAHWLDQPDERFEACRRVR